MFESSLDFDYEYGGAVLASNLTIAAKLNIYRKIRLLLVVVCLSFGACSSGGNGEERTNNNPEVENNRPPVISGNPSSSVTAGDTYDFTPTATDPDGDALFFSINETPAWASFDSGTGRLTGQPTSGDAAGTTACLSGIPSTR